LQPKTSETINIILKKKMAKNGRRTNYVGLERGLFSFSFFLPRMFFPNIRTNFLPLIKGDFFPCRTFSFSLLAFCPSGRFVPLDILSHWMFFPRDVLSLRTFFPMDILLPSVQSPDVLSPDVFSGHLNHPQFSWGMQGQSLSHY
jgi:hypothetical protein